MEDGLNNARGVPGHDPREDRVLAGIGNLPRVDPSALRNAVRNRRNRFMAGKTAVPKPPPSDAIAKEEVQRAWGYCGYCRTPKRMEWMFRLTFRHAAEAYACRACVGG